MEISKTYLLIIFLTTGVLLYSGCSPSSSTVRYNKNTEEKSENDRVIRFTDEDTNLTGIPSSEYPDSLIDDEVYDTDELAEVPDDEPEIDISEVLRKYGRNNGNGESETGSTAKEKVIMEIIKYLNTPYKYGGNSKNGIDCSAFTQTIFNNALSLSLLRSAREQYTQGLIIDSRNELQFGDLVFFNTRRRVRPGHVGIYIGDNLFAHASTKHGVIISSLDHNYYSRKYMGARRIGEPEIF